MWHQLEGTEFTLDIDYEKYLKAEEVFEECMSKYFLPPEAKEVNPLICLSPMPGGALTVNTQMMRDQKCLHLYPEVIKAMREVVARGGYGTSVTPVSQFYFQQAFVNVTQGAWKTITDGYGKMVLGYFGRTPAEPDPEIVKLAAAQLGLAPTDEAVVDVNDRNPDLGVEAARRQLRQAGLEETEERVFIVATCGEKGLDFLKGKGPCGIRYKDQVQAKADAPVAAEPASSAMPNVYIVTVNGQKYQVEVAAAGADPGAAIAPRVLPPAGGAAAPPRPAANGNGAAPAAAPAPAATAAAAAPAPSQNGGPVAVATPSSSAQGQVVPAPVPGAVVKVLVQQGAAVKAEETLVVLEAMKMQVEVKAPVAGTVRQVCVKTGDTVTSGQALVIF
jgi:pyruvate carboxylase subunit B